MDIENIFYLRVLLKGQEKEDEKKDALKLSLKYQFVTPLTSMVVTKPQEGDVEVADKPKEGEAPPRPPGENWNVIYTKVYLVQGPFLQLYKQQKY